MKVFLDENELYPVYHVSLSEKGNVEISDDLYARYKEVMAKWDAMQDELEAIYDAALSQLDT